MENTDGFLGFIHDKVDIAVLILYVLEKLPYEVSREKLSELVMIDGGFSWFEFSDALDLLVKNDQVAIVNQNYIITDNGKRNVRIVGSGLPYSVRSRVDDLLPDTVDKMERDRQIRIETGRDEDFCSVSMRLRDGVGEVVYLKLAVPDAGTAGRIAAYMKKDAENIYQQILSMLLNGQE